jgi:predicted enzyme related to lactoylglutathione lyase
MPRVVHFEIHADDPDRAAGFYSDLLGWRIDKWDGPADDRLVTTGPDAERGINGGIVPRRGPRPTEGQAVNAYVCTVEVPDLDDRLAKAATLGAELAVAKMPVPGVGWLAYIKDTEGNILGLMQPDPSA